MSGLSRHHVPTVVTVRPSPAAKKRPDALGWRGWDSAPAAAQNRRGGQPTTALPLALVGGGLLGMGIAQLLRGRSRTANVEEQSPVMAFLLPLLLGAGALAVAGWASAGGTSVPAGDITTPDGAAPPVGAGAGSARSGRASSLTPPDRWARPVPIMRVSVPSEDGACVVDRRHFAAVSSVRVPANAGFTPDKVLAVGIHREGIPSTETVAQRPSAIVPVEDPLTSPAFTSGPQNNPAPVDAHTNASAAVDNCGDRTSAENNPAPIPTPIPALLPSRGQGGSRAAHAPREQKTVCETSSSVLTGRAERFSAVRRNLLESAPVMCLSG